MFEIMTDIAAGARRIVASKMQAGRLRRQRRRLDRLYRTNHVKAVPAPIGADGQADRLSWIVSDYCQRGQAIADVHDAARVKLDAAEYVFSSLLKELSSVMGDAPSRWAPKRTTARPDYAGHHAIRAVAA